MPTSREVARNGAFLGGVCELPSETRDLAQKGVSAVPREPQAPEPHFNGSRARPHLVRRVTLGYRTLDLLEDEDITRFWIGSHVGYDRVLEKL